jgi:hypothetical protein
MKRSARFVSALAWVLLGTSLVLAFAFSEVFTRSQDIIRGGRQAIANTKVSEPFATTVPSQLLVLGRPEVRHHVSGFYGDRSLDVSIAIEQICTRYIRYTVRLQPPSGTGQTLVVTALAGGLQPEVQDMTGDHIPNDLVLTPTLLPSAPTVLVNDGHDHFVVAVSGTLPSSLGSSEDMASSQRAVDAAALVSSGFQAGRLTNAGLLFLPLAKEHLHVPVVQTATSRLRHTPSSGRAPPVPAKEI